MNCAEVQKYLSDFLDKSLDNERARAIEDHLAACSRCSEEMASLAECQRLVSGLPAVELPSGFTNRVMARVREAANPPSLWERLFLPLQIKIPLQATAVVLIAVLAAYIYQKEPLQRESVVAVQPESSFREQNETDRLASSVAPAPNSKTKEVAEETKPRVQELRPKPEEQDNAPGTARPQDQVRSPATVSPVPLQEKSSAASEAASPRREQSSSSREAQSKEALTPPPEKQILSKDTVSAAKSSFSPEARERSAASSLDPLRSGTVVGVALPADHELAIRLKEPVRDDKAMGERLASGGAQAVRRSLTSQEEVKSLDQARQRAIQTGQSQTVWVTIARNQYELFKKELADLGNIEVESFTPDRNNDAIAKSSDQLRIKVTILPPLPSGNPVPSQPSSR